MEITNHVASITHNHPSREIADDNRYGRRGGQVEAAGPFKLATKEEVYEL